MTIVADRQDRRAHIEALRQSGSPVLVYLARQGDIRLEAKGRIVGLSDPSPANRAPGAVDVTVQTSAGRMTLRSHGVGWSRYFFAERDVP